MTDPPCPVCKSPSPRYFKDRIQTQWYWCGSCKTQFGVPVEGGIT